MPAVPVRPALGAGTASDVSYVDPLAAVEGHDGRVRGFLDVVPG